MRVFDGFDVELSIGGGLRGGERWVRYWRSEKRRKTSRVAPSGDVTTEMELRGDCEILDETEEEEARREEMVEGVEASSSQ